MPKKVVAAAKTSVKKVAAKKVKKVAKPKTSKKELVYADNQHSFWLSDGQILNSLMSLQSALSEMEKSVYAHHVGKDKHDFANWVEVVLCDGTCAADLRKAKTPSAAKTVVAKHLKTYQL
jgi:hypothetical protein